MGFRVFTRVRAVPLLHHEEPPAQGHVGEVTGEVAHRGEPGIFYYH